MIDERVVVDTYSTDIVDPPHCHIPNMTIRFGQRRTFDLIQGMKDSQRLNSSRAGMNEGLERAAL